MVSLKRHQSNTLMTVKPLLQFSALIVSLEHQQQAQTVERVIGFSILRERLHTESQRNSVKTGESKQLETSAMLGWFQQAGGGIHVWNVMSGDTHIDSVSWVLPDVHFLSTIMDDDQVCVYVWERPDEYEYEFILHACLSTRTTWHLSVQWGIWCLRACRCSVRCSCDAAIIPFSWCGNLKSWTGSLMSVLQRGCFLLKTPLHLENLSRWLVEVTVLPGPLLPICFCVYVFVCV